MREATILEYADKAYIIPGPESGILELDDLTPTNILGIPDLVTAIVHKDRLFGAEFNSQRLYFSDVADFATFDGTSFIDVEGVDPSPITAFEILNDVLYIFKQNSIWGLYVQGDPAGWTLRLINSRIGATTKRATVTHEGETYFFSNKGFFITDGLSFDDIGDKVFHSIWSDIDRASAEVNLFTDKVLVSFATEFFYVFQFTTQSWVRWERNQAEGVAPVRNVIENQVERGDFLAVPYFVVADDTIYHFSDYEVAVIDFGYCTFTTKWFDMGSPTYMKKAKFWVLEYAGKIVIPSVTVRFDLSKEQVVDDTPLLSAESETEQAILFKFGTDSALHFRTVQFTVEFYSGSTPDLPQEMPTILGIYCHYELENRVKENI